MTTRAVLMATGLLGMLASTTNANPKYIVVRIRSSDGAVTGSVMTNTADSTAAGVPTTGETSMVLPWQPLDQIEPTLAAADRSDVNPLRVPTLAVVNGQLVGRTLTKIRADLTTARTAELPPEAARSTVAQRLIAADQELAAVATELSSSPGDRDLMAIRDALASKIAELRRRLAATR